MYELSTKQVFVSHNVLFNEHAFPFLDIKVPLSFSDDYVTHNLDVTADSSYLNNDPSLDFSRSPTSSSSYGNSESLLFSLNFPPFQKSTRISRPPSYLNDYQTPLPSRLTTPHPISQVLSYTTITPSYRYYLSQLSSSIEPQSYAEAIKYDCWKQAMVEELNALQVNQTWEFTTLPASK